MINLKRFETFLQEQRYTSASTSVSKTRPAKTVEQLYSSGFFKNAKTVLDFGAGNGRNANFLRSKGIRVYAYDKYNGKSVDGFEQVSNKLPTQEFDASFSAYVLNVVDVDTERQIIKEVERLTTGKIAHVVLYEEIISWAYNALEQKPNANSHIIDYFFGDDPHQELEDMLWDKGLDNDEAAIEISKIGFETGKDTFYRTVDLKKYGYRKVEISGEQHCWIK